MRLSRGRGRHVVAGRTLPLRVVMRPQTFKLLTPASARLIGSEWSSAACARKSARQRLGAHSVFAVVTCRLALLRLILQQYLV
jgi:hypothetical protein